MILMITIEFLEVSYDSIMDDYYVILVAVSFLWFELLNIPNSRPGGSNKAMMTLA